MDRHEYSNVQHKANKLAPSAADRIVRKKGVFDAGQRQSAAVIEFEDGIGAFIPAARF
jgi:hypothetical protein